MDTLLKLEQSREHPLRRILKYLGLSDMEIRLELLCCGLDYFPLEIFFMLRGHDPIPPDLEAAVRRIAAGHIAGYPQTQEEADELIGGWFDYDEDDELDVDV